MPTYSFTGYTSDALVYDSGNNTWSLRPDYDPSLHRVAFSITDDDAYLGGDNFNDEVGNDTSQTATVTDMSGTPVASGQIYDEEFYVVHSATAGSIWIERLEIDGQHVGYLVSAPLEAGSTYSQTTVMDAEDGYADSDAPHGNTALYSSFSDVPCFVGGTLIRTPDGDRPVENLQVGDLVTTLSRGAQPIRWIASRKLGPEQFTARPELRPIALETRWTGCAERMLLSPQHGVLVRSADTPEVRLARAIQLARLKGGDVRIAKGAREVRYIHFLLPNHETVYANGLATESFYPGPSAIKCLTPISRMSLLAQFPEWDENDIASTYSRPAFPYARRSDLPKHLSGVSPAFFASSAEHGSLRAIAPDASRARPERRTNPVALPRQHSALAAAGAWANPSSSS